MKKLLTFLLALVLVLAATGSFAEEENFKIGYLCPNLSNQGWLIITDGVNTAAKEAGVEFVSLSSTNGDTASWLNAFSDLKNMGCQAIVCGGVDKSLVDVVNEAVDEGYIIVEVSSLCGAEGTYTIGVDNYDAAGLGAKWLGEALGGKGTVVMINGTLTSASGLDRRNGFYDVMVAEYPEIELFEVASDWSQEKAMNGIEDAFVALNGEIDAIFCAWDGGTVVTIPILEEKGLTDEVILLGFDGAADALGLMREGKVSADVGQPLYQMGYEGINTALKLLRGEEVAVQNANLETKVITPETIDEWIASAGLEKYM